MVANRMGIYIYTYPDPDKDVSSHYTKLLVRV